MVDSFPTSFGGMGIPMQKKHEPNTSWVGRIAGSVFFGVTLKMVCLDTCFVCFASTILTQNNDASSVSLGTFFPPLNYDKTHRSRLQMERSKLCHRWVGNSSSKFLASNRVENKWNSHRMYSPYKIIWVVIISEDQQSKNLCLYKWVFTSEQYHHHFGRLSYVTFT